MKAFRDELIGINYDAINENCRLVFEQRAKQLDEQRLEARRQRKSSAAKANHSPLGPPDTTEAGPSGAPHLSTEIHRRIVGAAVTRLRRKRKVRPEFRTKLPSLGDQYVRELESILMKIDSMRPKNMVGRDSWRWGSQWIDLERGLLHLLFAYGQYGSVHEAVRGMRLTQFPKTWLLEIEDLWNEASYRTQASKQIDQLTPVNRYRIRRRMICPTLSIVGDRKYKIDQKSKDLMTSLYDADSWPKREQKLRIVSETGLPYETVTNWFKNRRQRLKQEQRLSYWTPMSIGSGERTTTNMSPANTAVKIQTTEQAPCDSSQESVLYHQVDQVYLTDDTYMIAVDNDNQSSPSMEICLASEYHPVDICSCYTCERVYYNWCSSATPTQQQHHDYEAQSQLIHGPRARSVL